MPHAAMKKDLREQLKARLKSDRQRIIANFHEDGMPEKLLRAKSWWPTCRRMRALCWARTSLP